MRYCGLVDIVEIEVAHRMPLIRIPLANGRGDHLCGIVFEGEPPCFVRRECARIQPNVLIPRVRTGDASGYRYPSCIGAWVRIVDWPRSIDDDAGGDRCAIDIDPDPRCLARPIVGKEHMLPVAVERQRIDRGNLDRDCGVVSLPPGGWLVFGVLLLAIGLFRFGLLCFGLLGARSLAVRSTGVG